MPRPEVEQAFEEITGKLDTIIEQTKPAVIDDAASAAPGDGDEIALTVLTHENAHVLLKTPASGLSQLKVIGPSTAWELDVHFKNTDYQKLADYFTQLAERFPQT